METGKLRFYRFITPSVIAFLFWWILGIATGLWRFEFPGNLPGNLTELIYHVITFIIAVSYYFLPLRNWANRMFFDEVNENLRRGMIRISRLNDQPHILTWKAVRGVFYSIVDNDLSLTNKAKSAYCNGLFWTGAADLRALSVIFLLFSLVLSFWVGTKSLLTILIFLGTFILSWPLSKKTTNLHKDIGNQQLEIIGHNYQQLLREKLEKVLERSANSDH